MYLCMYLWYMCVVGNDTYDYKDISLIPYIPCIVMYSHFLSQMKYSRKGYDTIILYVKHSVTYFTDIVPYQNI